MRAAQKILILLVLAGCGGLSSLPANPFATQVVRAVGPFGSSVYGNTNAVLGAPATRFYDPFAVWSGGITNPRVKLVEPAYNIAANTNGLLTPDLLLTLKVGSQIIVRFDQPVYHRPEHPYGVDFIIFGNTFYLADSTVNDLVDMSTCGLAGSSDDEPLKVSVSPGYTGLAGEVAANPDTWPWYRYDNGPYGCTVFPTQAYQWNRATASWSDTLMDFTKPVNPAMQNLIAAGGLSAADAIDLYNGSGGGTGFDLSASGFSWIQYVKIDAIDPNFSSGQIDALASVRPMVVGDALTVTPENIQSNTATLYFQKPGATDQTALSFTFTALDAVAQITTATFTNQATMAPLPGNILSAFQTAAVPLLQTNPVNFTANLALSVSSYTGTGGDLRLYSASGTNWVLQPAGYQATNQQVQATWLTNLTAFVVVQITAPALSLSALPGGGRLSFTAQPGLVHTVEYSTNLVNWLPVSSFTASNAQPVVITDTARSGTAAFYRVKVSVP